MRLPPNLVVRTALVAAGLAAALAGPVAGCGGGDITLIGNPDDSKLKVTFKGNLDSISPVSSNDIVVFVHSLSDNDDSDRCPCPTQPSTDLDGKAVILTSGETEFTLTGLEPDKFGVVFLLDKPGNKADGTINPGDPIAILDDKECQLDNVPGNITVTLTDVDLDFSSAPDTDCTTNNPPAAGRARADVITKQKTTTTTK